MDHREIAVRVPVMNEMQFLFPSEPRKSLKPRSLYVVFVGSHWYAWWGWEDSNLQPGRYEPTRGQLCRPYPQR
jgi:hypothetical protein